MSEESQTITQRLDKLEAQIQRNHEEVIKRLDELEVQLKRIRILRPPADSEQLLNIAEVPPSTLDFAFTR